MGSSMVIYPWFTHLHQVTIESIWRRSLHRSHRRTIAPIAGCAGFNVQGLGQATAIAVFLVLGVGPALADCFEGS